MAGCKAVMESAMVGSFRGNNCLPSCLVDSGKANPANPSMAVVSLLQFERVGAGQEPQGVVEDHRWTMIEAGVTRSRETRANYASVRGYYTLALQGTFWPNESLTRLGERDGNRL
jgi:hypothetical protein